MTQTLLRSLAVLACSLTVASCAPLFKKSIDEFDKGFNSAKTIITDRAQAMDAVKRRKSVEASFYEDQDVGKIDANKLASFNAAVCAASDYLTKQVTAMETLGIYDQVLETTNAVPQQNIGSLFKSIKDNWDTPDALKPVVPHAGSVACAVEVENLLRLPPGSVPEFAPLAVVPLLTAAGSVLTALKDIAVFTLGIADDLVRGHKIRRYVRESQQTVEEALGTLSEEDKSVTNICRGLTFSFRAPCRGEKDDKGQPIVYSRLDGVTIAQKWAALRKPWHLFLAMYSTRQAYLDTKKAKEDEAKTKGQTPLVVDAAPYWYLLDRQQDDLNEALRDYWTLAGNPGAGDVARSLRRAHEALLDLANGKITAAQAWAVLSDYGKRMKAIADDIKTLSDAKSTLAKKVGDVLGEAESKSRK